MARVTAQDVKEILETNLADQIIDTFITGANLTVTKILGDDTTLSSSQKTEIERWFSAHLIACTRQQQAQNEKVDDAAITYQGKTDKGLDATFYGQQVKILDTTGKMANRAGKKAATFYAVTSFD